MGYYCCFAGSKFFLKLYRFWYSKFYWRPLHCCCGTALQYNAWFNSKFPSGCCNRYNDAAQDDDEFIDLIHLDSTGVDEVMNHEDTSVMMWSAWIEAKKILFKE